MPHTKCREVYYFNELDAKATEKARDWYRAGQFDYEWWDFLYEDAARIGLKLTGFDLDRNRHATGHLTESLEEVCKRIQAEHGADCATYKTATVYLKALASLKTQDETYEDSHEELTSDLEKELLDDYARILQEESEYLSSDAVVDEAIIANEYEFTKEGRRA